MKSHKSDNQKAFSEEFLAMIWKMILSVMSKNKANKDDQELEQLAEELSTDYFRTFIFDHPAANSVKKITSFRTYE